MIKEELLKAFQFRHACKLFDENKKVSREDLDFILETGRLSPSSFGVEQWKFLIIESQEIKNKLKAACYNQAQLTTCSHAVAILAKIEELSPENDYVRRMLDRYGFGEKEKKGFDDFYSSYYKSIDVTWWSISQCHIAAANMMTAAAVIGIDSCPIGGFDPEQVRNILDVDKNKHEIALIVPFGYRANPQPQKNRLSIEELVEYR